MDLNAFKRWAIDQGSVAKFTDGKYLGECVSLISQYLGRVYGISAGSWGNAKDWATNAEVAELFTKVNSPQAGDIGVSGATRTNPYGHIWIYLTPTQILEQNGRVAGEVTVGVPVFKPIAILRRKGSSPKEETMTPYALNLLAQLGWNRAVNSDDKFVKNYQGKDVERTLADVLKSSENLELRTKAANYDKLKKAYDELAKKSAEAPKGYVEIKEKLYRKG